MKKEIVAAFDFDGTITTKDALLPFLCYWEGVLACGKQLSLLSPYFLGFVSGVISRQILKEALTKRLFAGRKMEELLSGAEAFANSTILKNMIREEALTRIQWHREQNHRLVLVSAAYDLYVPFWGKQHGFADVLCTCIAVDRGVATGKLSGSNCWGEDKVKRLKELLGPRDAYELYAYGNSRGDRELLAYADHPFYKPFN